MRGLTNRDSRMAQLPFRSAGCCRRRGGINLFARPAYVASSLGPLIHARPNNSRPAGEEKRVVTVWPRKMKQAGGAFSGGPSREALLSLRLLPLFRPILARSCAVLSCALSIGAASCAANCGADDTGDANRRRRFNYNAKQLPLRLSSLLNGKTMFITSRRRPATANQSCRRLSRRLLLARWRQLGVAIPVLAWLMFHSGWPGVAPRPRARAARPARARREKQSDISALRLINDSTSLPTAPLCLCGRIEAARAEFG